MTFQRMELGQRGEDLAVEYLKQIGYRIIERNFKNKLGEIDIIAKDKDALCFIEVKTRRTVNFGSPFEAVTSRKKHKLIRLAQSYLQYKKLNNIETRFDCVAVFVEEKRDEQIEIIKGAFEVN